MALQYGLYAEQQGSGDNLPHILSFLNARATAGDTLFEVWNGSTSAARSWVLGLNGEMWSANGSVAAPVFSFLSDPDSGLYRIGANNIGVAVGGAKVVDVAAAGVGITGTLGSSGDFAINTNKFTVAASTGNTAVAGTLGVTGNLSINTSKFTVAAATGNTVIAGTLSATGKTALTGGVRTARGSGISVPVSTATTLLDLSTIMSTGSSATWGSGILVYVGSAEAAVTGYAHIVANNNTFELITSVAGIGGTVFSISGSNLQITQTSGATRTCQYVAIMFPVAA